MEEVEAGSSNRVLAASCDDAHRIDPAFYASAQKLLIEAVVGAGISQVTIWVDGVPLATLTESRFQAWWQLSAGEHRFWATGVTVNQ